MDDARWPDLHEEQPGVIPLRPLDASDIFRAALSTLRANAALLFGISLALVAAGELAVQAITGPMMRDLPTLTPDATAEQVNTYLVGTMPILGIAGMVGLALQLLVTAVVAVVVSRAVIGRTLTFGQAVDLLRPRLLPLLGLILLVSALVTLGLIAFTIPGVWLFVLFTPAVPALMLEHGSLQAAMRRSRDLMRGAWWRTFGLLLVVVAIGITAQLVVGSLLSLLAGTGTGVIGSIITSALITPFAGAVMTFIYVDRRFRTDDLALELARAAGIR